ncbi:unnamed protein product [Hymenolepis diminuta]|uniref:Uncharacterized protein n=1 Tax=Hymenolepis diminuta TaxID=6216 RepID=A0A564XZ38_HYMDI|nr:unnamed protein product [Hymenolepis diminuta]
MGILILSACQGLMENKQAFQSYNLIVRLYLQCSNLIGLQLENENLVMTTLHVSARALTIKVRNRGVCNLFRDERLSKVVSN